MFIYIINRIVLIYINILFIIVPNENTKIMSTQPLRVCSAFNTPKGCLLDDCDDVHHVQLSNTEGRLMCDTHFTIHGLKRHGECTDRECTALHFAQKTVDAKRGYSPQLVKAVDELAAAAKRQRVTMNVFTALGKVAAEREATMRATERVAAERVAAAELAAAERVVAAELATAERVAAAEREAAAERKAAAELADAMTQLFDLKSNLEEHNKLLDEIDTQKSRICFLEWAIYNLQQVNGNKDGFRPRRMSM